MMIRIIHVYVLKPIAERSTVMRMCFIQLWYETFKIQYSIFKIYLLPYDKQIKEINKISERLYLKSHHKESTIYYFMLSTSIKG